MSFARPTLSEIVTRVQADFVSRLNLTGAVLRRSLVYVLSRVIAGASHMLHGHLDWNFRQLFPDTSEDATLVRQAAIFGMTKTAPTFATGGVTVTGTNGTVVPAGRVLTRSDGERYTTDADATITGGTAHILITAVVAGAGPSLLPLEVLTFESPVSGVSSTAETDDDPANLIDGADEETPAALRVRFLERLVEPAMGGTLADYVAWAKQVSGVTRAWVTARAYGPGTVLVRFVRDDDFSIIPDAGEVAVVRAHLETVAPAVVVGRPGASNLYVEAPTDAPIAFTIAVVPNTTAVKAAVTAELTDLLRREAVPGGTVLLSALRTAIGTAPGLTDYSLVSINGAAPADVTHAAGEIPSLGTITWS